MCECQQCDPKCLSCGKPLDESEGDEYCDYCEFCRPLNKWEIALSERIVANLDPDELPF